MCLSAMMNLMLEEMHEQPVASFGLHGRVAVDPHNAVENLGCQCIADSNQALVDRGLRRLKRGKGRVRHLVLPGRRAQPSALQRIDIEEVNDMDVVQRALQARKEPGSLGFEISLRQSSASSEQAMVCPGIVVGERTIGLHKSGRRLILPQTCASARATYSAASLVLPRFGFRAFFSTGSRNLPV